MQSIGYAASGYMQTYKHIPVTIALVVSTTGVLEYPGKIRHINPLSTNSSLRCSRNALRSEPDFSDHNVCISGCVSCSGGRPFWKYYTSGCVYEVYVGIGDGWCM